MIAMLIMAFWSIRRGYIGITNFRVVKGFKVHLLLLVTTLGIATFFAILNSVVPIPDMFNKLEGVTSTLLFALFAVMVAPITEEILFRGVFTTILLEKYPPKKAILLSAAIFAGTHLNLAQILPTFAIGILLAWLYWRTNSLWLPIFAHTINNLSAVILNNQFPSIILPSIYLYLALLIIVASLLYPLVRQLRGTI